VKKEVVECVDIKANTNVSVSSGESIDAERSEQEVCVYERAVSQCNTVVNSHLDKDGSLTGVCSINGEEVEFLMDSGCNTNVLSKVVFDRLINKEEFGSLKTVQVAIQTASGVVNALGEIDCMVQFGSTACVFPFLIVNDLVKDCVLGTEFIRNCPATARSMEELGEACERSTAHFRALSTQATQVLDPNLSIQEKIEQMFSCVECKDIRQLTTTPLFQHMLSNSSRVPSQFDKR
jgi:hypothetical protein